MTPEVWTSVSGQLNRVIREIETRREANIQTTVRSFVSDLVLESLLLRGKEWGRRLNLDPDTRADAPKVSRTVEEAVHTLMDEATIDKLANGDRQILLIGAVEQAHRQFCKIFPFCR